MSVADGLGGPLCRGRPSVKNRVLSSLVGFGTALVAVAAMLYGLGALLRPDVTTPPPPPPNCEPNALSTASMGSSLLGSPTAINSFVSL